jgi:hypothetical protein
MSAVDLIIHEPAQMLPNEILWQIFEFLIRDYGNHKLRLATGIYLRTLHAISITWRHFHHAVQPYLYGTILIEHHAQLHKLHDTIVNAPYLGNHMRHLVFCADDGQQVLTREFLTALDARTTLNSQSTGAIGSGNSIGNPGLCYDRSNLRSYSAPPRTRSQSQSLSEDGTKFPTTIPSIVIGLSAKAEEGGYKRLYLLFTTPSF